jgi:hypothetical protein
MTVVKRFTAHCTGLLWVPPDARATYNENWKDVVLASDYDAVVADLKAANMRLAQIAGLVDGWSASETPAEPKPAGPMWFKATCCKCGKVVEVDAPVQGLFFCGYGCT